MYSNNGKKFWNSSNKKSCNRVGLYVHNADEFAVQLKKKLFG